MSAQTLDELHECLWAWAKGYLPYEAAVRFVIDTGTLRLNHPLIEEHPDAPGIAAFNFADEWETRIPHASGGELATWRLAEAMTRGVLADEFGRLDRSRKVAFVTAMAVTWMQG